MYNHYKLLDYSGISCPELVADIFDIPSKINLFTFPYENLFCKNAANEGCEHKINAETLFW
jgi:hypothetical protein